MRNRFRHASTFLLLLLSAAQLVIDEVRCDLYLFTKDKDIFEATANSLKNQDLASGEHHLYSTTKQNGNKEEDRLYLFPNSRECLEQFDLDTYLRTYGHGKLCNSYCVNHQDQEEANNNGANAKEGSSVLTRSAILQFYRNFIHSLLSHLNYDELLEEERLTFQVNLELSDFQMKKLKKFSDSVNDTDAAIDAADVTHILKNMFRETSFIPNEPLFDRIGKTLHVNFADHLLVIWVLLAVLTSFIFFKAKGKNYGLKHLILTIIAAAFVTSVISNHMILTQKKQILREQKLLEIIPEECFPNTASNVDDELKQPKEKPGFVSVIYNRVKKMAGYSPTSKECLDYKEALFIHSYQNNYLETIVHTFFEAIRPVSMLFGEFINQFYSSLVKDLSFYQAIPVMILVTGLGIPFILYGFSFLMLMLFNYEFSFLKIFTIKKSSDNKRDNDDEIKKIKDALATQKKEMMKALKLLREENEKLMVQSIRAGEQSNMLLSIESNKTTTTSSVKRNSVSVKETTMPTIKTVDTVNKRHSVSEGTFNINGVAGSLVATLVENANEEETSSSSLLVNESLNEENDDGHNLSIVLDKTVEDLIENINMKEIAYKEQLSSLKEENERLKLDLAKKKLIKSDSDESPPDISPSHLKYDVSSSISTICSTAALDDLKETSANQKCTKFLQQQQQQQQYQQKQNHNNEKAANKIVMVGLSKTVHHNGKANDLSSSQSSQLDDFAHIQSPYKRATLRTPNSVFIDSIESSTERIFQNNISNSRLNEDDEVEEEDDDEDIYVIYKN